MLMVPGASNVVRINGTANLTGDEALRARFAKAGKAPRTVTVIRISKIYFQCARALVRARLWAGEDDSAGLPTAGDLIAEATTGDLGGPAYDSEWNGRAASTLC